MVGGQASPQFPSAMPKTEDEAPLTVEDILCVKGGRLGTKVVKVPIEYEDIDGVKIRIFRVRKRDFWLLAPFLNRYPTGTKEKEMINRKEKEMIDRKEMNDLLGRTSSDPSSAFGREIWKDLI